MNKWGEALHALSPRPPDPGMGRGNVPFAPGIMSGNASTPGSSSQLFAGLQGQNDLQNARAGMMQATATPSGQPGADGPPQRGQQPIQWTPDVQQQVMGYLMNMLRSTGRDWKLTTTGGTSTNVIDWDKNPGNIPSRTDIIDWDKNPGNIPSRTNIIDWDKNPT
jgi:hypothetical protein